LIAGAIESRTFNVIEEDIYLTDYWHVKKSKTFRLIKQIVFKKVLDTKLSELEQKFKPNKHTACSNVTIFCVIYPESFCSQSKNFFAQL
jgi:predicted class III extradiol MEMO1 family dioxygenase